MTEPLTAVQEDWLRRYHPCPSPDAHPKGVSCSVCTFLATIDAARAHIDALKWLAEEMRQASFPIARSLDNFCRVDHEGQCHSHLMDRPCSVVRFRRSLSLRAEADWPGRSELDRKATG